MSTKITAIALVLGLMITFTACETDNKTLLTDGAWKFKNMTTDSEDEASKNFVLLLKVGLTDGTLEFNSDNTFTLNAPVAGDPQTGTWSLIGDDQLLMEGDDGSIISLPANIQSLSKKELKYLQTLNVQNLGNLNVTTTWERD